MVVGADGVVFFVNRIGNPISGLSICRMAYSMPQNQALECIWQKTMNKKQRIVSEVKGGLGWQVTQIIWKWK